MRLIEVNVDTSAYDTGRRRGGGLALAVDLQRQPDTRHPNAGRMGGATGALGVSNETEVYGDNNNWFTAFAYWLFSMGMSACGS